MQNGITRFGKVTYELHPNKEKHTVHAVIDLLVPGGQQYPALIKLALRAPASWGKLVRAEINGGQPAKVVEETVEIDGSLLQHKVEVEAYFRSKANRPEEMAK